MNAGIQAASLKAEPELGTHGKSPREGGFLREQYRKGKKVLLQLDPLRLGHVSKVSEHSYWSHR